MKTVVAVNQNEGVLPELQPVDFLQQFPDQRIDITDAGVVAVAQLTHLGLGDLSVLGNIRVSFQLAPTAGGPLRGIRRVRRVCRQRYFFTIVQVPIFFWRTERQVGFSKTDREKKLLFLLSQLAQHTKRVVGHDAVDVVIIHHVGGLTRRAFESAALEIFRQCIPDFWISDIIMQRRHRPRLRIL